MNAKTLFGHWGEVRRSLLDALDLISDEQLAFVPRRDVRSLGDVLRHIASAEEGWFRYAVTRELSAWPEYTAEEYATVAAIRALLDEVHAGTDAYLNKIAVDDLDRTIEVPWGQSIALRWIIWHVVEHEIHHRGEVFLMLGLLGVDAPDI